MVKMNEVKNVIAVQNMRSSTKATGGANNVACLTPKFKDMPESTFQEYNTSKNVLKRKMLMLIKIDSSEFDVDCGFVVQDKVLH